MADKIHELLDFWFGDLGTADLPTSNRTSLWFGDNEELKIQMYDLFNNEFTQAKSGQLQAWTTIPRGS